MSRVCTLENKIFEICWGAQRVVLKRSDLKIDQILENLAMSSAENMKFAWEILFSQNVNFIRIAAWAIMDFH